MRHCLLKPGLWLHVGELRDALHMQVHGMPQTHCAKGTSVAGPSPLARYAGLAA